MSIFRVTPPVKGFSMFPLFRTLMKQGKEAFCGPIELSNVYARHFAKASLDGLRGY